MSTRAEAELAALVAQVARIPRAEFLAEYWEYRAGEHVTVLAPSGGGKSQLGLELLGATATPKLPAYILVMKPQDETVTKFAKQYHFRVIREWPPPPLLPFQDKPSGYVLWPKGNPNVKLENQQHSIVFGRAIQDLYWRKGKSIIFADEGYSLEAELKLSDELNRVHTKGRSMSCGLWTASQRPAFISQWAYQANHLFLGNDPDRKARDRYGEIASGIDPALIRATTASLRQYEFLYICRDARTMCIVEDR